MNGLSGFTPAQRVVLDRYARFLGTLNPIINNIPTVFERRRSKGHQLATLSADSRLNNAVFNERYLTAFWKRTDAVRLSADRYVQDVATFSRETLDIIAQTSRREPVSQVDFRLYSLARSPVWKLYPAQDVQGLIQELILRFYELRADIRQLKYTTSELYEESFGLNAVFTRTMNHASCKCHQTPTVVQELFAAAATTPVWDLAYSSADASIRAAEFKADIAVLFNGFSSVNLKMGVLLSELHQRVDDVINELFQAKEAINMGELNFNLRSIREHTDELSLVLNDFERWLRT